MTTPARHLRAAAHALDRQLANALRPLALTPSQHEALAAYADAGPDGTTNAAVARTLGVQIQTTDYVTRKLLRRGLIAPGPQIPDNGRAIPFAVTADGQRLLKRADDAVAPVEARTAKILGIIGARTVATAAEELRRPPSGKSRRAAAPSRDGAP